MLIERTTTGDLIFGKVVSWKPGAIDEDLTILILIDEETNRKIKVLCWNSYFSKLSDRARSLLKDDCICVRAEFDVGDPSKCTAFDLKKSGIYDIMTLDGRHLKIAYGEIRKVKKHKKGYKLFFPYYKYSEKIQRSWCIIHFLGWQNCSYIKNYLNKGNYCIIYLGETKPFHYEGVQILYTIGKQMMIVA